MSRLAYILVLIAVLTVPTLAHASAAGVIRDCAEDGDLDRKYSNKDLKNAQGNLPSDLDEYSDCREVIGGAITGGSDRGGGRDNTPSEPSAAKLEVRARDRDEALLADAGKRKPKLNVAGTDVEPGKNGLFDLSSASNGMPLPLLLALIAGAVLAVAGGLYALRNRIPFLARLPLPSINLPRVPFPRRR